MEPVRLVVYSDYLCPWCFNASERMKRLEEEFGEALSIRWQSFLLRPRPKPIDVEAFRTYTKSWLRPAADPDGGAFRVWEGDEPPPSHSVPPHCVAKAAEAIGEDAFRRVHERLLRAYFSENRNITDESRLRDLWRECDLPEDAFERSWDPAIEARVIAEYEEAIRLGVTGVPAVRMETNDVPVVGALPLETYRRWVARAIGQGGDQ